MSYTYSTETRAFHETGIKHSHGRKRAVAAGVAVGAVLPSIGKRVGKRALETSLAGKGFTKLLDLAIKRGRKKGAAGFGELIDELYAA